MLNGLILIIVVLVNGSMLDIIYPLMMDPEGDVIPLMKYLTYQ